MITEEIKLVLRDRFPDTPDVRVELVWDPPWLGSANLATVAAFPLSSKNTGHCNEKVRAIRMVHVTPLGSHSRPYLKDVSKILFLGHCYNRYFA